MPRQYNTAESMSNVHTSFIEIWIAKEVGKGAWRMPWLIQAMKDVISCEKLRAGANDH